MRKINYKNIHQWAVRSPFHALLISIDWLITSLLFKCSHLQSVSILSIPSYPCTFLVYCYLCHVSLSYQTNILKSFTILVNPLHPLLSVFQWLPSFVFFYLTKLIFCSHLQFVSVFPFLKPPLSIFIHSFQVNSDCPLLSTDIFVPSFSLSASFLLLYL